MSDLGTLQTTFPGLLCQLPGFLLGSDNGRYWKEIGRNKEEERHHFPICAVAKVISVVFAPASSFFLHFLGQSYHASSEVVWYFYFQRSDYQLCGAPPESSKILVTLTSFLQFPTPKLSSFSQHLLSMKYSWCFLVSLYSSLKLVELIPHVR